VNRSVKRIIALTILWLCAAFAFPQAPIGVCLNNVAQTISNGVIAPIPYATIALCTPGSTAANCVAHKVNIFTSTALSTATPTNPFTADAGGNYFFCAAVGHYGVLISSSYGTYFVNDFALVDDWSKGGTMTGALTDASGFIGPLTGNAATASASDHTPTQCGSGLYSRGDSTTWAANCAQVQWSQLGGIPSLVTAFNARTGYVVLNVADVNSVGTISNDTYGNAATASALDHAPNNCGTGGHTAYGIDANGNALCNTVVVPRTCNSYGCYKIDADGTINESILTNTLSTGSDSQSWNLPHNITNLRGIGCTPYVPGSPTSFSDNTRFAVVVVSNVLYYRLDNSGLYFSCLITAD
jgi:hypothetical protein